jgi:SWI/SNF-related matrix-associated actin-dependent regulator of chromatin subfamily B protein 1
MTACLQDINTRYPDDRVEITLKNPKSPATAIPEWRLKCLDCPGRVRPFHSHNISHDTDLSFQLYNHGPGESLSNFEVHVKNRIHRQRVLDRIELDQDR